MEMGYCTLNQKYSPELVRQAAIGTPASAAALVGRAIQVGRGEGQGLSEEGGARALALGSLLWGCRAAGAARVRAGSAPGQCPGAEGGWLGVGQSTAARPRSKPLELTACLSVRRFFGSWRATLGGCTATTCRGWQMIR